MVCFVAFDVFGRAVSVSYVVGCGDGGNELGTVSKGCCCLCLSAFACAAVGGGVEYRGVGGCMVVGGVPVGGCVCSSASWHCLIYGWR